MASVEIEYKCKDCNDWGVLSPIKRDNDFCRECESDNLEIFTNNLELGE